uniref:B30.2/SPRY domain-containing protein n=2 Tax=Sphaeramia orbicularis TaxID=375764 RepID=A0A672YAY3_9TELE
MSRSLYIMCHIPIFCWIAAKVFEYLLPKMCNTQCESINIPTTLTEMYTHFLVIQMQVATEKYSKDSATESDTEEIFRSNKDFIWRLGRMAYEQLDQGNIIFTKNVLEEYGIDLEKASVNCGLCTEIFKEEESVFASEKHYCFVHLTVQEYFAALFVYHSFTIKNINSQNLKDFLLKGSEEELQSELEKNPLDLPLDDLLEISIANSTIRKTGELDMFLRFLLGMSLQSTQKLLRGLIKQTENHSGVIESIKTSLLEMDLTSCSPERCLNLVHCLIELKEGSLHGTVQQYLRPDHSPDTQLSPVQCSALADLILMSSTPLDEFNLMKYKPSSKGIFRLIPAVRNCRKARISGVNLDNWLCEAIASALQMPNSVLTELHLTNNDFCNDLRPVIEGLRNSQCTLNALSLSGSRLPDAGCEIWGSAIKSLMSNLRELELSDNVLGSSLCCVLSDVRSGPKLETLRLNRNADIATVCEKMVVALTSKTCCLRELELNHTNFKDSEMGILSTGLMSTTCTLEILSVSHNKLTEKCCETLASVLSSKTSKLRYLDLSYNDLHDSGVRMFCSGLRQSNCALTTLRLSFCKVTADGCASLASALSSDHCSLRELDLSFNHLTDQGVKKLTELQQDSHCSLEKLNVDYNDKCWFDLQLLREYACDLTLDPNTAGKKIILSEHHKKAKRVEEKQEYPDHPERFLMYQVLCKEGLSGRHYWEVECVLTDVGVAYKSMDRTGDCSVDYSLGRNEKSWCWCCRGEFYHNNSREEFGHGSYPTTMGVYLDWPAGILSFFEVFPQKLTHLYTVHTTFTEPLYPGFCLDGTGEVSLCKIK